MATRGTATPPPLKRRKDVSGEGSSAKPVQQSKSIPQPSGLFQQTLDHLNGDGGAGYAISFVLHAILLALLAIPVIRQLETDEGFTTVVENATDEQVIFDAPIETLIPMPDESSTEEIIETDLFDPTANMQDVIPDIRVNNLTTTGSDGEGAGDGGEIGGGRIAEPENAIKAGNFSVWPWPIVSGRNSSNTRHGKPGAAPRARQDYSIVIRVKVPDEKKFVRLSEYSGSVVGTDGYRQKIPDDAYYFRTNGELARARPGQRMPVIDGTAELLIRVPGAGFAQVKDTITVYSRTLEEEQEIELEFQALD